MFIQGLRFYHPVLEAFDDIVWWNYLSKLTTNEIIEGIYKKDFDFDLKGIDFEWEILLSKQRYNFQNICATYEIVSIPVKIQGFGSPFV